MGRILATVTDSGSAVAPSIPGVPTISGSPIEDNTLTASPSTPVTGTPAPTRTWQWERSGTPISGATSQTYTLVTADVGETITVVQTETNASGSDTAESSATATVTAPSAGALTYSLGVLTPQSADDQSSPYAQPIPVPGTSNGTYGAFTVASNVATWTDLSGESGSQAIGSHTVNFVSGVATVSHIDDITASGAVTWAQPIEADIYALGRSLPIPDPSTLVDIVADPPFGINVNSGGKLVTMTTNFAPSTLSGYKCVDHRFSVDSGVVGKTIQNMHFEVTAATKGTWGSKPWFAIQGSSGNVTLLESARFIMPADFAMLTDSVIKAASSPAGVLQTGRYIFCPINGGDFMKPDGRDFAMRLEYCVIGPGGATTGLDRSPYSGGASYTPGEYVSNPNGAGLFECISATTGNAPPNVGNARNTANTWWKGYDPHSDGLQTALLRQNFTFYRSIISQRPLDVTGNGDLSGYGFVNCFRWNSTNGANQATGTLIADESILLRIPGTNPAVTIASPSATGWPTGSSGAQFTDCIIEGRFPGTSEWLTAPNGYVGGNPNFVYRINGCVDAASGNPIVQVGP